MKKTLKEKIKNCAGVGFGIGMTAIVLVGGLKYSAEYYATEKTETTLITGCKIISVEEQWDMPYAKYLTPKGEMGEAIIPTGLEKTITESLYVKHQPVYGTVKTTTRTRSYRGHPEKESIDMERWVKSLETQK